MKKKVLVLFFYIILFYIINLVNSRLLLSYPFNKYIISFKFSAIGFFNSLVADFAILSIFLFIGLFIFKKRNGLMMYLLFITLFLNILIFTLYVFTRFYFTIFSFSSDIFNNPGNGLVWPVILQTINEFFVKFRFLYFTPFVILLIFMLRIRKKHDNIDLNISLRDKLSSFFTSVLLCFMSFFITCGLINSNKESSLDVGLYAAQNGGLYSFYINQFLGVRFKPPTPTITEEEMYDGYIEIFDKNKDIYINQLDSKEYSRKDELTGILKGTNLYMIQLESYNNFFINQKINGIEVTPNLNRLVRENYYFSNVMTSVGIGNTSDAEFSTLTGLYANGDSSVYWDYNEWNYDFVSLPRLFNLRNYETTSYHGNVSVFYNRKIAHENMLYFNVFKSKDDYNLLYPEIDFPDYYYNTWVSDQVLLEWGYQDALADLALGKNFFKFQVLIQPHTPYSTTENIQMDWGKDINRSQLAYYLDNIHYNDMILGDFLDKAITDLPNTLFVLYGDHGSTIQDQELRNYLNISSSIELRDILNQIPVLFIDNTNKINEYMTKEEFSQVGDLAKSERDIFRTIVNFYDFYKSCEEIFGINMFSNEPSIIYEAKNVDFKTDDFYTTYRNTAVNIRYNEKITDEEIERVENIIGKHRFMNNYYLNKKAVKIEEKSNDD